MVPLMLGHSQKDLMNTSSAEVLFGEGNSFIETVKSQGHVNLQPYSDFRLMLNDLLRSGSHLQIRKEINIFSKFLMEKIP